jgi:pSer/pThr/pTyr-binding forkhead associated (FHA) protein
MTDDQNVVDSNDLRLEQEDMFEGSEAQVPEEAEVGAADEVDSASLTVKRGGVETDEVFNFTAPAVVGRFDPAVGPVDVDLGSIPESTYVSRKHARITCDGGVWKITDMGSSNGTFVLRDDFERVDEAEISNEDEIAFGNARMIFRVS